MYRTKQGQKKKRKVTPQKTRRRIDSFLNRYDFSYAGRDTVNQAAKVAPSIIKDATNEINNIIQQAIIIKNQTIIIKIYITENVNWFHYSHSSTHNYD